MKLTRIIALSALAALSAWWLFGYVRAVLPLVDLWEYDGFRFLAIPDIAFYRAWQHASENFGPLRFEPFLVADFPTGEAAVVARFPAWPTALAAVGCLAGTAFSLLRRRDDNDA